MASPVGQADRRAGVVPLLAFGAFVAVSLVLAATPLVVAPPVVTELAGPSLVPAGRSATFEGRVTLAGVGLGGEDVAPTLDGRALASVTTGSDGRFRLETGTLERGVHRLAATVDPGGRKEAPSGEILFRAVLAPPPPTAVERAGGELRWSADRGDDDRPVQVWRIYQRDAGEPWALVATVPSDVRAVPLPTGGGGLAVAAVNVAGESAWLSP